VLHCEYIYVLTVADKSAELREDKTAGSERRETDVDQSAAAGATGCFYGTLMMLPFHCIVMRTITHIFLMINRK